MEKIIQKIIEQEFGSKLNSEQLIHMRRSVVKILNTEHKKISFLQLERNDLTFQIYLALKEVSEKYDPSKNVPLISYTNFIVKRRILDFAKFLRRDKRKATIIAINAYRGSLTGSGQQQFDKDVDNWSYERGVEEAKRRFIKTLYTDFVQTKASKVEAKIAEMMYKGYSQKEIIEILGIKRKVFLECKEKLKNFFKYFNNNISKL
ncbi:hypothetical protein [Spiroplasma endosymbiont of Diplazon laetatorius]|uniref:hypothetical protein n=1 Tax=Spiroplasma endosymbiont of Diplazon laetatorius TaxID=3066322 RepID=UPI0030D171A6